MTNHAASWPPPSVPSRTHGELAYNEAVRTLHEQQASLESARARATTLFAANSLVAGFLGGRAVDATHYDTGWQDVLGIVTVALGVLVFVAAMVALLYVLWPRKWKFSVYPEALVDAGWGAADESTIHASLARALGEHIHTNDVRLPHVWEGVRFAVIGTASSTVLWLLALFVVKD